MQVYDENGKRIGILAGYKDRTITESLDSGDKELSFLYPISGPMTELLKEECYIRTQTDEFVLKSIENADDFNTYTASLNVEELEAAVFISGFESVEKTIGECLTIAFAGTGWTVTVEGVTKRRTVRETDQTSAWSVLQKALTTYRCECNIDSLNKSVEIRERVGQDTGCYFMEGLNLKKLSTKSDTYDFYTRIYPIGKDGITPASMIGQDYIDNFQYSRKVKPYVWKDERYTNVSSLVEDATAKLEELSRPHTEYSVEIKDLAAASETYKDILSYGIGDTVTLISKTGRIREKQRIVKLVRYPEAPEKNTAEISNASKTFAEIQQEEVDSLTESISDETEERKEEDLKTSVRLEKTENSIEAEVAQRISDNLEMATKVAALPHKISMEATGGEKYVGIVIQLYDENGNLIDTTSGAANITITGFVTFNDLANAGSTTINGANITTGVISCDRLNGGTIRGQRFSQTGKYGDLVIDNGVIYVPRAGAVLIGSEEAATQDWVYNTATAHAARTAETADYATNAGESAYATYAKDATTASYVANTASAKHTANMYSSSDNKMYYCPQGSSKRFKTDIAPVVDSKLDPHRLYDLNVVQFKYKPSFYGIPEGTPMETVIGIIAEDVEKVYPCAVEKDEGTGQVINWMERYLLPPMLSLIQEQHREIEQLKIDYINLQAEMPFLKNTILQMEEKEMLRQQKTTNLSATLTADVGNGEEKAYVYFSATVQADGKHSVTYTVQDEALFSANKEEFDKERKAFEKSVEENLQ